MKSRDVYVLLLQQQLAISLAASLQGFSSASRFPAMASSLTVRAELRQTAEIARDRRRSSPCHGGLPALRCHVFSCGHRQSDAQVWRMTTLSIYNPQHHRTATSAPRLSSTRFIRMASCHSDKTLFVSRCDALHPLLSSSSTLNGRDCNAQSQSRSVQASAYSKR